MTSAAATPDPALERLRALIARIRERAAEMLDRNESGGAGTRAASVARALEAPGASRHTPPVPWQDGEREEERDH